jgi:outer membrane protein OmpA-like peptidoglycan-associated protein
LIPEVLLTAGSQRHGHQYHRHTDTTGDRGYNYQLSLVRARKVAGLLASQGIDPNILEIESHGEDNLLVKTGDEVGEPRNRRVEITVW